MAKSRVGFSLLDARCCFNFGGKVLERGCNGNPYFWKLSWWQPGGWSLINWSPVSVTTNLFLGLHLTFQSDTSTNTTFIKWVSSKLQKNQEHKFQNQVSYMSGLVDQQKVDRLTGQNVICYILKRLAFRKYSIPLGTSLSLSLHLYLSSNFQVELAENRFQPKLVCCNIIKHACPA